MTVVTARKVAGRKGRGSRGRGRETLSRAVTNRQSQQFALVCALFDFGGSRPRDLLLCSHPL